MIDVKLENYLESIIDKKFKWGELDCVFFACNWCEAATGKNPAEKSKGKYNNSLDAQEHLKSNYNTIDQGMSRYFKKVNPAYANKGDVALCIIDGAETLGIFGARGFVFFKSDGKGLIAKKEPNVIYAWRVE